MEFHAGELVVLLGASGWNGLSNLVAGNFGVAGYSRTDLIGVERSTGITYLSPGKDDGTLGARIKIADNWKAYSSIASGDFNGSGYTDLLVPRLVRSQAALRGNRRRKFAARVQLS